MANFCDIKSNAVAQQNIAELSKLIGSSAATAAITANNGNPLNLTQDGEPSQLYQDLLDFYEDEQKASYIKSQIYSSDYQYDGEPSAEEVLREHYDLATYKRVMKFRLKQELDKYQGIKKIEALKKFNADHKTNFGYIYDEDLITDEGFVVTKKIRPDLLAKSEYKLNASSLNTLLEYLKSKFPSIHYEILSGTEYFKRFQPIFKTTNLPNSFVLNNIVYINSDVITEEILYEEFLHPLVNQLKSENRELFDNLYAQAAKDFPQLYAEVSSIYSSLKTEDEELVTQTLSRYLKEEISITGKNNRTLLGYVNKVLSWIGQHLQDLFGLSSKDTKLSAKDFKNICTFKDLAEIINSKEVTIDSSLKGWRGSLNENLPTLNPIIITDAINTAKEAEKIGGIDMLRHPDANGMHFGNPFSHNKKLTGVILTNTVKEAVEAFEKWLRKEDYLHVQTERRDWILSKLESGELIGKPLVYYTTQVPDNSYGEIFYNPETAPNHVHILQKLIQEYADLVNYKPKDQIELKMHDFLLFATGSNSLFIRFLQGDEEAQKQIQKLTAMWQQRQNELLSFGKSFGKVQFNGEHYDFETYFKSRDNLYNEFTEESASVFNSINNFKVHEAQVILPKTYESSFKLGSHTLAEIDENFFKKVNPYYKTLANNTDLLVRLHNDRFNISIKPKLSGNPDEVPLKIFRSEDGYRLDQNGNKMYKLPENSAVFVNAQGNEHIVLLDDELAESNLFTLLNSVDKLVSIQPFMSNFRDLDRAKKITRGLLNLNNIKSYNSVIRDIIQVADTLQNFKDSLKNLYLNKETKFQYSKELSSSLYNSFLQSLQFVAARIPTQDLQSFMAMKNVAFTASKGNDVFVTRWQYWLQGSKQ